MRPLALTEDEQLLAESAARVVAERAPIARFRANRDAGRIHDPELWAELVALGWPGIALAEDLGGSGMGLVAATVVVEALGRTLAQTPLISAVMAGPLAPGVAAGEVVAVAWREGRSADPARAGCRLGAGRVTGRKVDVLERTLGYLAERTQFGVPIGTFQVLQHRAVDAFARVELARATVLAAAADPTAATVSLAKATCAEAYLAVTKDAIQMHGGIGMTDEHDIGLYLKRAMVCQEVLGSPAWHRARWAAVHGY